MHGRIGLALLAAMVLVVGCAQILGIEDLPPLPDAGPDAAAPPDCGNGILEEGEVCDDGNIVPGDGCSADCHSDETCGNAYLDIYEVCDDGNTVDGDGCSANCQRNEKCGNGEVDEYEVCDDGNTESGDGCSGDCRSAPPVLYHRALLDLSGYLHRHHGEKLGWLFSRRRCWSLGARRSWG